MQLLVFWRNPGTDPMISFEPSDKVGHSDPKNKYHAINSVYYIFSIQVYITFLSIQVHTVLHIVLLCLIGCISFIFKVLVNFGSQLYFFFFNLSNIHVTWVPFCVLWPGGGGVVGVVVVGGVQSHDWAFGPWGLPHKRGCFPHSVQNKSFKREE